MTRLWCQEARLPALWKPPFSSGVDTAVDAIRGAHAQAKGPKGVTRPGTEMDVSVDGHTSSQNRKTSQTPAEPRLSWHGPDLDTPSPRRTQPARPSHPLLRTRMADDKGNDERGQSRRRDPSLGARTITDRSRTASAPPLLSTLRGLIRGGGGGDDALASRRSPIPPPQPFSRRRRECHRILLNLRSGQARVAVNSPRRQP